ncbi:zinc finger domain-containing protein [Actinomadura napierensis]|uniref:DNA-binding phage zinc finger domain-containing protein n=1 Tax=Actinomadura napierensis TaxID=267854 RepID=A0ABN3AFA4_9ACTN
MGKRKDGRRREKRPSTQLPDVRPREVPCPRCLAVVGASCRNGRGEPVAAHADRRRRAAEAGRRPPQRVVERRQLQEYQAGAGEPPTGQARNPMDEFFAARRDAATTRGRSADRQRRVDGL